MVRSRLCEDESQETFAPRTAEALTKYVTSENPPILRITAIGGRSPKFYNFLATIAPPTDWTSIGLKAGSSHGHTFHRQFPYDKMTNPEYFIIYGDRIWREKGIPSADHEKLGWWLEDTESETSVEIIGEDMLASRWTEDTLYDGLNYITYEYAGKSET